MAAALGQTAITSLLLPAATSGLGALLVDASTDAGAKTPLLLAAGFGHTETATLLLDAGASVEAKDVNGCSPLHVAADGGHAGAVKLLLARGANIEAIDSTGWAALQMAAEKGHTGVADVLLDQGGADIEANNEGSPPALLVASPLHDAYFTCVCPVQRLRHQTALHRSNTPMYVVIETQCGVGVRSG